MELLVDRLMNPGGEFRVHRHWFDPIAMDAKGVDFSVAEKDRLYRSLDRIWKHKRPVYAFAAALEQ